MVAPPLLWSVVLLVDALAIPAVAVAWRQLGRQQGLARLLEQEVVELRLLLEQPERKPAPERKPEPSLAVPAQQPPLTPAAPPRPAWPGESQGEPEFLPVSLPHVEAQPFSALDRAVAVVNDPLAVRVGMLRGWERAAGVRLAELSAVPAMLAHRNRELADAQSLAQVTAAEQEIEAAWRELLPTLAGSMDRDVDPGRASCPLQEAMDTLLRDLGVSWIDPPRGTPFDPRRHLNLGVLRTADAAEAGRVGEVLCRGLEDGQGRVLLRAEVREFG